MVEIVGCVYRDNARHKVAVRKRERNFYIERFTFGWDIASRAYDTSAAAIAELERRARRNGWTKIEEAKG